MRRHVKGLLCRKLIRRLCSRLLVVPEYSFLADFKINLQVSENKAAWHREWKRGEADVFKHTFFRIKLIYIFPWADRKLPPAPQFWCNIVAAQFRLLLDLFQPMCYNSGVRIHTAVSYIYYIKLCKHYWGVLFLFFFTINRFFAFPPLLVTFCSLSPLYPATSSIIFKWRSVYFYHAVSVLWFVLSNAAKWDFSPFFVLNLFFPENCDNLFPFFLFFFFLLR